MSFLISNKIEEIGSLDQKRTYRSQYDGWNFYSTEDFDSKKTPDFSYALDGYIADLNIDPNNLIEQRISILKNLNNFWPLPQNITGSFSACLINRRNSNLILCNDLIGVYPVYYLKKAGEFFISNSLIWIAAASGAERDETGIAQRALGREFCNLGRRTIIKNCKRLLPGEYLKFDLSGEIIEKKYDNSLFQELGNIDNQRNEPVEFWNVLKKELVHCLNSEKINIALSGGIDSRILVGALPKSKEITCYTYGKTDNYETKVALKIAKKIGANFKNFSEPLLNFPGPDLMKKYTLYTEAVYLCSWLEILENVRTKKREPFLLGDLSTAISGRTIKKYSTKKYRQKNYFKHSILNKEFKLEINTSSSFNIWKSQIIEKFSNTYNKKSIEKLDLDISLEELKNNNLSDLSEMFERIEAHNIKYIELVDELFTWYTHTRFPMGKQILINNSKFKAYCPGLSMSVIRHASNIEPNFRLDQRFVRRLFREISELRELGSIPTSQIPLIPQNFPDIFRFPIWALRSKVDDFLIKRLVNTKDPKKRYRLFKSNNWVDVYQNPELEQNLNGYFENCHLGEGYIERIKEQALQRRDLRQWPLANMNIINAGALNTELELISNFS